MFTTFVPPVDATVISRGVDSLNRTQVTARCNVPEGAGQTLTVGLINDGGAEGVEFLGQHYPLTASNVTAWGGRGRCALNSFNPYDFERRQGFKF